MHETIAVPNFARAGDYAGVWAIEPAAFAAGLEFVRRADFAAHVRANSTDPPRLRSALERVRVGTSASAQEIAVIRVVGTLMKGQSSLERGTSTVQLRRDLREAANDPNVSAILLAVDSPGGTVAGTDDLAREVRLAQKRKPVWAYVDDLCASAAYWVASQAEKVFANSKTALVGSIGTLMVVYDLSVAAEKDGVRARVFATGPLKGAGVPGTEVTAEQTEYFQGLVNESQKSFDDAVRLARGLTPKQLEDVRTGGVFGAESALTQRLIDGIQSFDATLAALAAEARKKPIMGEKQVETRDETLVAAPSPPAVDLVTEMRRQAAAEAERQAAVRRICATHSDLTVEVGGRQVNLQAHALAEGWTADQAELAALRAARASVRVNVGAGSAVPIDGSVLEAAVAIQRGHKDLAKHYKPEVLEAADKYYRNIGLQQLFLVAATANGYHGGPGARIHGGNVREVLAHAFPQIRAGFSSVSLPGILGNVANKELLMGYMEEDQTWREIATIKNVSDFKQVTSYRLLDSMEYEELGPGGEIKHGTVDSESYTRQAKTYAKMFSLERTTIINDDLGAFDDLRNRIGRGAAQKLNNVFWTAMLADHSTFFTTARGNYITGATTTLLTDGVGLGLAIKAFRQMKTASADGSKRVGGRPEILLVPPELEYNADQLFMGEKLTDSNGNGLSNTYRNKYRSVVCAWLSDSNFTGYSTTAWYLLRNPSVAPMIAVSFLNGQQSPTVESADADFNVLGVQFRGYHDFGCDKAEYLCGVKSKGAA